MGLWDRLMGRGKKAADDEMGDSSMHAEGMQEQGMAEDRPAGAEQMGQGERERPADSQSEHEGM